MNYFKIEPKNWESNFFGFNYGNLLIVSEDTERLKNNSSDVKIELDNLLSNSSNYELVEINLDSRLFFLIPTLEDYGFRLLDTKSTYITKFEKSKISNQMFDLVDKNLKIRTKKDVDFEKILKMSVDFLVNDKVFVSKYKNLNFFEKGTAEKYYSEWIKNTFFSSSSYFSILVDNADNIKGFFIYDKRNDTIEGLPIYKGILTVLEPEVRGNNTHLALQSFIFKQIEEAFFYVENATQVTNIPVIRNHIKSHRMLHSVTFNLVRKTSNN